MLNTTVRRSLLASTIVASAMIVTFPAFAQNTPTSTPPPTAPGTAPATPVTTDEAANAPSEIIVTGSLIRNPNLQQASPVNVTTAETIALRQNNVAEEVLRDIPGIVPNIGSAVNNGNGGASYVDLRGLGSFRNLVLLDGNRIAPSGLLGRVDLNNIPLALVERVDALTGGASTTYGADAVSGVVNFVTKRDFSGVEISAGTKLTERGDGNYNRLDVTVGTNLDDGRGNAVLSIGYQQADPVYQGARDFSVNNIDSFSGLAGGSGTSLPSRFSGTRPIDPATGLPSVNPATANGGVRQINTTTGQAVPTFATFNFNPYNIFQTPFRRFNIFGAARYEVADNLEVYTRALFSKNTVSTIIAPSGVFGSPVTIPLSNPFLPVALRNQFCAFNIAPAPAAGAAPTYVPRFTPAQCAAASVATSATDPNYRTVTVTLNRRTTELGPRISDYVTTIFDYRAGVRGSITDSIKFDVSGSYGESENRQTQQNYVLTSRVRDSLLATNPNTCLSGAATCIPVNFFGPEGSITPAQGASLTANSTTAVMTSLAQARAVINGDFGYNLPFTDTPINFAIGTEYRKYRAQQRSDLLSQTPGELGGAGGAAPDVTGGYDVYEGFGEVEVPIVSNRPFFNLLSLNGGARYSSYTVFSPSRPKFQTFTWKAGLVFSPIADLKIRGGYARSKRAPNIGELFTPVTTVLTNLAADPCSGTKPVANAALRAVCIAQGAPAGTIGSITDPTGGQANISTGGNVNLRPETSNSYTFGAVFTPSAIRGLSLTVDYYNITVKDAVTTPTPGDIISACFNTLNAASAACTNIRRSPLTGGLDGDPATVPGLFGGSTNLGRLKTDGIDAAFNFKRDLGFAKFGLSAVGNYTFRSRFKANQTDPKSLDRECVGYFSANCSSPSSGGSIQPKFQWTVRPTLGFDGADLSLQWRHIDKVQYEPAQYADDGGPGNSIIDQFRYIKAYDYFDLSARFDVMRNFAFTFTINNLLDRKPPIVGSTAGSTAFNSGNTYPSTYDALGRMYAASVQLRF